MFSYHVNKAELSKVVTMCGSGCLLMHGTLNCRVSVAREAALCTASVTTIFSEHCIAIDCGCKDRSTLQQDDRARIRLRRRITLSCRLAG